MRDQKVDIVAEIGFKPLNKAWAKIEILMGLTALFLGGVWAVALCARSGSLPMPQSADFLYFIGGIALFVAGGYLTLAGHRSHLYQSSNALTAFLLSKVRRSRIFERCT